MAVPLPFPYDRLIAASERTYGGTNNVEHIDSSRDPGEQQAARIGGGMTGATYNATLRTMALAPDTHERLTAFFENRYFLSSDSQIDTFRKVARLARDLFYFHHEGTHAFQSRPGEPRGQNDRRRLADEGMTHNATLTTFPQFLTELGLSERLTRAVLRSVPTVGIYDKEIAANKSIVHRLSWLSGQTVPDLTRAIVAHGGIVEESIPHVIDIISAHQKLLPSASERENFRQALQHALIEPFGDFITLNSDDPRLTSEQRMTNEIALGTEIGQDSAQLISAATAALAMRLASRGYDDAADLEPSPVVQRKLDLLALMQSGSRAPKPILEEARFRRDFTTDLRAIDAAYARARSAAIAAGDRDTLRKVERDITALEHPYTPPRMIDAMAASATRRALPDAGRVRSL